MPESWRRLLAGTLLLLGGGTLIGWYYGHADWGLLAAALCGLAWHIRQLLVFEKAMRVGDFELFRYGDGIWSQIFARFSFLKQRSRKHKRRYRQLLREVRESTNAMPDGGVVLNSDFEIILCNKAAQELLNLKQRQDRGQRIDNMLRDPQFIQYLKSGVPAEGVEIASPAQAGNWLLCRVVPYGGDQQLLLIRDITERKRLATMRREFVANASHELRSPLTVISGYLDTLADDPEVPQAWRSPVAQMRAQAARMNSIVAELLELSSLEASAAPAPNPVPTCVCDAPMRGGESRSPAHLHSNSRRSFDARVHPASTRRRGRFMPMCAPVSGTSSSGQSVGRRFAAM
jgi:two-component system phosphate regulon sensor histidine kinase PhoR